MADFVNKPKYNFCDRFILVQRHRINTILAKIDMLAHKKLNEFERNSIFLHRMLQIPIFDIAAVTFGI